MALTLKRFPGVYTRLSSSQEFIVGNNPPASPVSPPAPSPAPPPSNNPNWSTLDVWNSFYDTSKNLLSSGVPGVLSGYTLAAPSFTLYLQDRSLGGGSTVFGSNLNVPANAPPGTGPAAFFLIYNGPGQNCQATIDMSQWGGPTADADAVGAFQITQGDGNLIVNVLATATLSNYNRSVSGNTLVVPFTLAAGVTGVSDTILIQGAISQGPIIDAWIEVFDNEVATFQLTAVISNV
jgi:hypothetical protein